MATTLQATLASTYTKTINGVVDVTFTTTLTQTFTKIIQLDTQIGISAAEANFVPQGLSKIDFFELTSIDNPVLVRTTNPVGTNGTATGTQSTSTLGDSSQAWIVNQYAGMNVTIATGTGSGQTRQVVSNTATVLTITPNWGVTPVAASSTYAVVPAPQYQVQGGGIFAITNNTTWVSVIGIAGGAQLANVKLVFAQI